MQRVLSFPTQSNRGFGDSSEFVTKRMCFSFMFSIGFLAILAGFLLGRFVFDQELELSRTKLRKAHQHHQQVFGTYKNYSRFNATNLVNQVTTSTLDENLMSLRNMSTPRSSALQNLHEAKLVRSALKEADFDLISPLVQFQVNLSYPDHQGDNQVLIMDGGEVVLSCNDSRDGIPETADLSYSNSATITGNVFYVNFGLDEDYHYLDTLGISVKDSIVVARVGMASAVDLVTNALDHDARGIVLYLDPQQKDVDSAYLTASDLAKLNSLHNGKGAVPVLCVSEEDAEKIFRELSSRDPSPEGWRGNLNTTYPIGPGFKTADRKMVLKVNTVNMVKRYYNVFGAIRGSQEPDRYVIVAQERKADGESTAIAMEIIRVLGFLKKTQDWKPHRSIVVASWGAEGRFRSDHNWWTQLKTKTVAYLRIESGLLGVDSVSARGTLILDKVFREAVKILTLGKPSLDSMFRPNTDDLVENGVPFLELKQSEGLANRMTEVTSFWTVLTWELAESHGLPFGLDAYVSFFNHSLTVIGKRFKSVAQKHSLFLDSFFEVTRRLTATISSFQRKWSHAALSKSIEMRIMNDQYLQFTRAIGCHRSDFIQPSRHVIFSRSGSGHYPAAGFGVLQDLLRQTSSTEAPDDLQQQIVTHLATLVECTNEARYALADGLETFILGKNETHNSFE